jgi:hypothetical protein
MLVSVTIPVRCLNDIGEFRLGRKLQLYWDWLGPRPC